MVIDGLKGNDVDLVSLDHCTDVPSHLTDLGPAAQNYDSCLATMDSGDLFNQMLCDKYMAPLKSRLHASCKQSQPAKSGKQDVICEWPLMAYGFWYVVW